MSTISEEAGPVVRARASFQSDLTWWEFAEERLDVIPLQLSPEQYVATPIGSVDLEYTLGNIEPNKGNCFIHGNAPSFSAANIMVQQIVESSGGIHAIT